MTSQSGAEKHRIITAVSAYGAQSPMQALESVRRDLEEQLQAARRSDPAYVITNVSHHITEWKLAPLVTAIATLDVT